MSSPYVIQREDLCQIVEASNSSPRIATKALSARARSVTSSSPVPQAPSARLPQHHRIAPLLRKGQGEDEVAARAWASEEVAAAGNGAPALRDHR